ncbi:uncharacterized protein LOC142224400 isoform X2 [Haematobia irritans]
MSTIVTTKNIASRFAAYCKLKNYQGLRKDSFITVEPYIETDVIIDRRHIVKMLFCESGDLSGNLLVIAKDDNIRANYIYAGNVMDLRTVIFEETFISWMENSQQYLYMNLTRSDEDHLSDERDHVYQVLDNIQQILEYHPNYGINLHLPPIGYEYCIEKILNRFKKHVAFSSQFKSIFEYANDDLSFMWNNKDDAKIILYAGAPNSSEIRPNYRTHHRITVNILRKNVSTWKLDSEKYYYEIFYKPEHSPFELQYLTMMTRPKYIYGILDINNKVVKVPEYLRELCDKDHSPNKRPRNPKNKPAESQLADRVIVPPIGGNVKPGVFLDDSDSSE